MTGPAAKVIADSVSRAGRRLTTFEVAMHRFVLAEFNTHRTFCLAGDAELEFDLPAGNSRGGRRVHRVSIRDFVERWHDGANRVAANPKREHDLTGIEPGDWYEAQYLSDRLGFSKSEIHRACREGRVLGRRGRKTGHGQRRWEVEGASFVGWRESKPEHTRFSVRDRLADMQIRQLNEDTGDIQTANVVNCVRSGVKDVYEIRAAGFAVAGSSDHLVMTTEGYCRIADLQPGVTRVLVRKFGKTEDDRADPMALKKIDGRWRSVWQNKRRSELIESYGGCQDCGSRAGLSVHHVIPVYQRPDLTFEDSNIRLLCESCHQSKHRTQGWQGGTYLYGAAVTVESVEFRGSEETFDLNISGPYPNFIASGVVVHNSRNSASSRAIPAKKQLERVENDPALPLEWASEQKGMQGGGSVEYPLRAQDTWLQARYGAIRAAGDLVAQGVHKSLVNRLLEPFMWHTVVVSATAWENFFRQRVSKLAQPEIRAAAELMQAAYQESVPTLLDEDQWHLPYIRPEDRDEAGTDVLKMVSVARCARVSYLTQDGVRSLDDDVRLYNRLVTAVPMHASPLEHVARPDSTNEHAVIVDVLTETGLKSKAFTLPWVGNFLGWRQHRLEVEVAQDVQSFE